MPRFCLLPLLTLYILALPVRAQPPASLRGGAVAPASSTTAAPDTFAWGHGVFHNNQPIAQGNYGRGGCLADWNHDGRLDLILNELPPNRDDGAQGSMVALLSPTPPTNPTPNPAPPASAPTWTRELIDTGASFRDCLGLTLYHRPGLLVTHLQMQLRFYERTPAPTPNYREIYSIYTPSAQSGLALADIDGDGRTDLLHGNYWLHAPTSFELGWRLFALNTWFDQPRSAMLRIVTTRLNNKLIAVEAESEASPARFAWFEMPADPHQQWIRHDIAVPGGLHFPQVLVNTDTPGVIVAGEDNGPNSRLLRITLPATPNSAEPRPAPTITEIGRSSGYLAAGPGGTPAVVRK